MAAQIFDPFFDVQGKELREKMIDSFRLWVDDCMVWKGECIGTLRGSFYHLCGEYSRSEAVDRPLRSRRSLLRSKSISQSRFRLKLTKFPSLSQFKDYMKRAKPYLPSSWTAADTEAVFAQCRSPETPLQYAMEKSDYNERWGGGAAMGIRMWSSQFTRIKVG